MKVLVLPGWYPGKYTPENGNFFAEQVKCLRAGGVDAVILFADLDYRYFLDFSSFGHKRRYSLEDGIPTFRMSGSCLPKKSRFILKRWSKKYLLLYADYVQKKGKPDLIHAHTFWGGYIALLLFKKYGIPFIVTEHFTGILSKTISAWKKPIYKDIYQAASHVTVVSHALARELASQFDVNECLVIPNFIDVDIFRPANKPLNMSRFIGVGDLVLRKRFDLQIKAISELVKLGYEQVELVIVGGGNRQGELEKLVAELDVSSNVFFTGVITNENVARQMQQADFFLLTSSVETFGIVLVEALACGLPVISTNCQGPSDIVSKEVGLMIPKNDLNQLVSAMKKLLDNQCFFDMDYLRKYAVGRFSDTVVVESYKEIYHKCM